MVQPIKYASNDPLSFITDFLEKQDEDDLAEKVLDAFAKTASNLEQYNLLAKLYLDIRSNEKAIVYATKVLSLSNQSDEKCAARQNLAKLYNNINDPEKSMFYSDLNLLINPNDTDYMLEKLFSLYLLNRKPEAEVILRELASRDDLNSHTRGTVTFNLGTYDLEAGKFIDGLKGFLLGGKDVGIWPASPNLPYKFWDGGAYPGKTLVLFVDGGGIGDEMLQVRWVKKLRDIGFDPVFLTSRKDLCDIFNRCGLKTTMTLDGIPEDALWTYYMQVPIYLDAQPEDVIDSKYLYPSDAARDKWAYIKQDKKIKIGIRWQGNSKNERDLHRKVPLDVIMNKIKSEFDVNTISLYSLQVGDGQFDIEDYPEIIDITDDIKSYDDTLALLENLDYVITSCTSVLHASAIVGTKTLGLVPISAYFTWVSPPTKGRDSNTSIWYEDTLRLFRQVTPKSWDEPLTELIAYMISDISNE
jgi:tetratricopeptide (TPR) repeat protein